MSNGKWVDGEWIDGNAQEDLSDQPNLVEVFLNALKDETPLEGEDSGWVLIGAIRFGQTIVIRSNEGTPLFEFTMRACPGAIQDFDPNANYPVNLKRAGDGGVLRVSVNFESTMEHSNQPLTRNTMEELARRGIFKPKK